MGIERKINNYYNKLCENLLLEKGYTSEDYNAKIWGSDSEYQFKNFMLNLANTKTNQGYRLVIGPDTYAVASAMELNHDGMRYILRDELVVPPGTEWYTVGIPTAADFDMNNYEIIETAYDEYKRFLDGKDSLFITLGLDGKVSAEDVPKNLSAQELCTYMAKVNSADSKAPARVAYHFDGFDVMPNRQITEEAFKQTELYRALKQYYKGQAY